VSTTQLVSLAFKFNEYAQLFFQYNATFSSVFINVFIISIKCVLFTNIFEYFFNVSTFTTTMFKAIMLQTDVRI